MAVENQFDKPFKGIIFENRSPILALIDYKNFEATAHIPATELISRLTDAIKFKKETNTTDKLNTKFCP